jgi:hypothetical protein
MVVVCSPKIIFASWQPPHAAVKSGTGFPRPAVKSTSSKDHSSEPLENTAVCGRFAVKHRPKLPLTRHHKSNDLIVVRLRDKALPDFFTTA